MKTQIMIEGLLAVTDNSTLVRDCLKASHIINDLDRKYMPIPHKELFYLEEFKQPKFLIIIDKLVHVYVIGKKAKGSSYNILEIEGNNSEHLTITKTEITRKIRELAKENKYSFLPDTFNDKIIFLSPDYKNNILDKDQIFIFNKINMTGTLFSKSKWSMSKNMYEVEQEEYETSAVNILKAIYSEF